MKRLAPVLAFVLGVAGLAAALPPLLVAQPEGLSVTRAEARRRADEKARTLGIETEKAYVTVTWDRSYLLEKELADRPDDRRRAWSDPAVGPRLGGYRVTYFRPGQEKWPEFGSVVVGRDGRITTAVRRARAETPGAKPDAARLRTEADAFLAANALPGAPAPVFDSVRPTVYANRSDHAFRYRVPTAFPVGRAALYVNVLFIGDAPAGWTLSEEYADGSRFRYDSGSRLSSLLLRYLVMVVLLGTLLALFLRKYHAGEVGIGTGAALLGAVLALCFASTVLECGAQAFDSNFGGVDGRTNALAFGAFFFLFYWLPFAVLVFLGWTVGESFARERWGDKLAAFDALLRRDIRNATVGASLLTGLLVAPAVAAAGLLAGRVFVGLGLARAELGDANFLNLSAHGGPFAYPLAALTASFITSVVALLFPLSASHRRRNAVLGVALSLLVGAFVAPGVVPAESEVLSYVVAGVFALAGSLVFLATDLLATATALFGGFLLAGLVPLLSTAAGPLRLQAAAALAAPALAVLVLAAAGLATRRRLTYSYEDLAPHVRRIAERERVKAEIDAANRIQAALLPAGDPKVSGTSVASHYRAATEIGGDYFDFLPLPGGRLGLAFGDVSGHGLTSGIVMAMAKAALLVQVGYDASPARVMEVLNETVRKTAPKRILMTFFFGVLDPERGVLRFTSAGHLDPYVYRAATGEIEALSAWGFPLGVRRREPFREREATFEPGDRLVLFSDGLIEALDDDGEPFGFGRFEEVVRRHGEKDAESIRREILGSVKAFTRNRPPEDDQTLVVVSFDGVERLRKAG